MSAWPTRRLLAGASLSLAAALGVAPAGPTAGAAPAPAPRAEAPHAGACTRPEGVTVVVTFSAFGGGTEVRCAGWPVSSGYDALERAGYTVTGTQQFPGLLCRIDGLPADDPCLRAPSPKAYWGYWHAERGGSWTYSSEGAGTRPPPAGSVEGWAFGPDARPAVAPPAPLPPPTTAAPSPSPAPPPTAAPAGPQAAVPPTTAAAEDPAGAGSALGDAPAPDAADGPGRGGTATTEGDDRLGAATADEGPVALDALRSSSQPTDAGSPASAIAATVLVVGLGAGAAVQLRRRRRSEEH